MIYSLIRYNSKKVYKIHFVIIAVLSVLITINHINMMLNNDFGQLTLGDIFLFIFGGFGKGDINILDLIIFSAPHILIFYFVEIFFEKITLETPSTMFLRIGNLNKWSISTNISVLIALIKFYFIFFGISIISIIFIFRPDLSINTISNNQINDISQVLSTGFTIIEIIILCVMTIYSMILLSNNIYFISKKNLRAIPIVILFNIISVIPNNLGEVYDKFILFNQFIFKRHNIFNVGYEYLTIEFSYTYLIIFILVNLFLQFVLIKKSDF